MLALLLADPRPELVTEIEALFGKGKATRLEIAAVPDLEAAAARCRSRPPACAFVSSSLLALEDRGALERQIAGFGEVPVIVLAEPEHAGAAPRVLPAGADDWVPKKGPLFLGLPRFVAYALERAELRRDRRRLEERRRRDERLRQALVDTASHAVAVLDGEGRVLLCNRALGELLGRPVGRIEGHRFQDFLSPRCREVLADLERRARADAAGGCEGRVRLATGPDGRPVRLRLGLAEEGEENARCVLWLAPDEEAIGPPSTGGSEDVLRQALREVLARGDGGLPVARIHLLGLDDLRTALAGRWEEFETEVRDTVERVLRSRLEPGERFCREEDLGYVVVLGEADDARAAARIRAIEEAIRAAVLGAEELAERGRLHRPPLDEEARRRLATVETSMEKVPVAAEDLAAGEDLWEILRARSRCGDGPRIHPAGILAELRRSAATEYEPALDCHGVPAPILLLAFDERSRELLERCGRRAAQNPARLLDLDKFVLERHLRLLIEEMRMGGEVALVDVHYDTLASRCSGDAYLALLEEIPEDLRTLLGFNIVAMPPGIYAPKVARMVSTLRPFSRLQALEVRLCRPEFPDLATIRAPMVTVPYEGLAGHEATYGERLRCLGARAHACKTKLLLRRVPCGWSTSVRNRYPVDFTCLA